MVTEPITTAAIIMTTISITILVSRTYEADSG
jgi:hypothetical protein